MVLDLYTLRADFFHATLKSELPSPRSTLYERKFSASAARVISRHYRAARRRLEDDRQRRISRSESVQRHSRQDFPRGDDVKRGHDWQGISFRAHVS
jgi:hypothetical protein